MQSSSVVDPAPLIKQAESSVMEGDRKLDYFKIQMKDWVERSMTRVLAERTGGIQSIGEMTRALAVSEYSDVSPSAASSFDSLGYPNISPSKLLQWFSKELHDKFSGEKAKSELLVLDADMLGSGLLNC